MIAITTSSSISVKPNLILDRVIVFIRTMPNAKVSDGSQPAMTLVFQSERNSWLPFAGPSGSLSCVSYYSYDKGLVLRQKAVLWAINSQVSIVVHHLEILAIEYSFVEKGVLRIVACVVN